MYNSGKLSSNFIIGMNGSYSLSLREHFIDNVGIYKMDASLCYNVLSYLLDNTACDCMGR